MCGKKTDPRKSMAQTGTLSEEKYCLEVIAKTQTIQTWLYRESLFSANPYTIENNSSYNSSYLRKIQKYFNRRAIF